MIELPPTNRQCEFAIRFQNGEKLRFRGHVSQINVDFFHPLTSAQIVINSVGGYRVLLLKPESFWKRWLDYLAPEVVYDGPTGRERLEKETTW